MMIILEINLFLPKKMFLHSFEVESLSGKILVAEKNGKELFKCEIPDDINASKIILSSPDFKNKKADDYKIILEN